MSRVARTLASWALAIVPGLVLLALWGLITPGAPDKRIMPSPSEVVASYPRLHSEQALVPNLVRSFARLVKGFGLALIVAFPLGLLMGSSKYARAAFTPFTVFGAYLPVPLLVMLTLSLIGGGELQIVIFLALAFTIILVPPIVAAADTKHPTTAYTRGALRNSWPAIYQAMRRGFGVSWTYVLLAEMVGGVHFGIGPMVITSAGRGRREEIYLVLFIIVAVTFVTDMLWAAVGRWLFTARKDPVAPVRRGGEHHPPSQKSLPRGSFALKVRGEQQRECPNCSTTVTAEMSICPACGFAPTESPSSPTANEAGQQPVDPTPRQAKPILPD